MRKDFDVRIFAPKTNMTTVRFHSSLKIGVKIRAMDEIECFLFTHYCSNSTIEIRAYCALFSFWIIVMINAYRFVFIQIYLHNIMNFSLELTLSTKPNMNSYSVATCFFCLEMIVTIQY